MKMALGKFHGTREAEGSYQMRETVDKPAPKHWTEMQFEKKSYHRPVFLNAEQNDMWRENKKALVSLSAGRDNLKY